MSRIKDYLDQAKQNDGDVTETAATSAPVPPLELAQQNIGDFTSTNKSRIHKAVDLMPVNTEKQQSRPNIKKYGMGQ